MMFKTIDIHGKTCEEAKKAIEQEIRTAPKGCELTVIHGYHSGQALQTMVRSGLRNKRIKRRILGLNNGETILVLD